MSNKHIVIITPRNKRKKYTVLSFVFDIALCVITGGLWLIWIFIREMRRRG